jgi:peptidoglycan/xylan/chitin deacetylase (PgdA/CDA1 family)
MSKLVSIVMYHYVRELKHSRFPEIKGLSIEEFKNQIRYIKKHYNIISADDIMDAVDLGSDLPPRALLLTFDDGYLDHFTQVFPVLDQEKLPGCFFPTAKCILENRVLDVNKIHFILASVEDKGKIVENISQTIDRHRSSYSLETTEKYWQKFGKHNRFDLSEVVFIKRMLQRELPEKLRKKIIGELFNQYVTKDEIGFSKELYMSLDQLACIQRNGMYVGSHSFDHDRLNSLSKNEQKREIDLSLKLLKEVGCNTDRWMMCYPHGAFDDSLLSILKKRNCVIGLKSQFGIADLDRDHPLTLPRLDTNDLPKEADAFFR